MDFIILKVNGTDVSSFPHEDAVRAFLTAEEPIVVEVKRRISENHNSQQQELLNNKKLVSTEVQTDVSSFASSWFIEESCCTESNEIDLEEITLRKCSSDEKLGLTVCYSSGSEADTCTEVYIRNIAPQSVADKDGRLRQGDQILQVNGKDVSTKEETECLFAENRKAVTLLVSRCMNMNSNEDFYDDGKVGGGNSYYNNGAIVEQVLLQQQQQQQQQQQNAVATTPDFNIPPLIPPHKLNLTNSLVRSKLDSINHEILELDQRMQNIQLININKKKVGTVSASAPPPPPLDSLFSDSEHIYETIPDNDEEESADNLELLEPIYSCPYEADNKEEERKEDESLSEEHENSSSAYNTGGSCNSNQLTFELAASADSKHKNVYRSTFILCQNQNQQESVKPKQTINKNKVLSPNATTRVPIISDTMYTNAANLQQTMLLQQQMLREALCSSSKATSSSRTNKFHSNSTNLNLNFNSNLQHNKGASTVDTRMEWKVKRRPDGSRYIARRPVRNRILKNRAIRISEERAGVTTEEDTISELKVGRYWTKDERKKHLEKSRERKQRQEILLASKNIAVEDIDIFIPAPSSTMLANKPMSINNKKVANNIDNTVKKHKSSSANKKPTYENYHPNANNANTNKMYGLLSVTTV